jgi:hypothetical protein
VPTDVPPNFITSRFCTMFSLQKRSSALVKDIVKNLSDYTLMILWVVISFWQLEISSTKGMKSLFNN